MRRTRGKGSGNSSLGWCCPFLWALSGCGDESGSAHLRSVSSSECLPDETYDDGLGACVVLDGCSSKHVAFVVGEAGRDTDTDLVEYFVSSFHATVDVLDATDLTSTTDFGEYDLLWISETVKSDSLAALVEQRLAHLELPIVVGEAYLFDDFKMAEAPSRTRNLTELARNGVAGVERLTLPEPLSRRVGHARAPGAELFTWVPGRPNRATSFAYPAGALMLDGFEAPCARIGIGYYDESGEDGGFPVEGGAATWLHRVWHAASCSSSCAGTDDHGGGTTGGGATGTGTTGADTTGGDTDETGEQCPACPSETPVYDPATDSCTSCPASAPYYDFDSTAGEFSCVSCPEPLLPPYFADWTRERGLCELIGQANQEFSGFDFLGPAGSRTIELGEVAAGGILVEAAPETIIPELTVARVQVTQGGVVRWDSGCQSTVPRTLVPLASTPTEITVTMTSCLGSAPWGLNVSRVVEPARYNAYSHAAETSLDCGVPNPFSSCSFDDPVCPDELVCVQGICM